MCLRKWILRRSGYLRVPTCAKRHKWASWCINHKIFYQEYRVHSGGQFEKPDTLYATNDIYQFLITTACKCTKHTSWSRSRSRAWYVSNCRKNSASDCKGSVFFFKYSQSFVICSMVRLSFLKVCLISAVGAPKGIVLYGGTFSFFWIQTSMTQRKEICMIIKNNIYLGSFLGSLFFSRIWRFRCIFSWIFEG